MNLGLVQPAINLGDKHISKTNKKVPLDQLRDPLKIWIDGAAKTNHISGVSRVGGVGVVYNHACMPYLYVPVENNLTDKATNNKAELQAGILGLEEAKKRGAK